MSAIWADFPSGNLGLYDTEHDKMTNGIWAEENCGLVGDPDPLIGNAGRVFVCSGLAGGSASNNRFVLPGTRTTVGMSARLWVDNIPSSFGRSPEFFSFRDGSNVTLCCVIITPTGSIQVRRGPRNDNVVVAETSGPVITADAWHHISVKVTPSATVGAVTIEREGVNILTATGLNLNAGPIAQVAITNQSDGSGFSTQLQVKDLFIWDGLGSFNNDHPGPVSVGRFVVNSDVSSGWTSTGATNYGVLDETPPNDADCISADISLPAPSIMGLENLPSDVTSVRGVFLVGRMRKSDGGDCKVQMSLSPNSGVDWADGSDRTITTAFTYWYDVTEASPDTGLAWTPAEFNAATFKVNRTL